MTPKRQTFAPQGTLQSQRACYDLPKLREEQLLSLLVHKIGHEIGNPLTAIISVSSVLERLLEMGPGADMASQQRLQQYLQSITREAWLVSGTSERLVFLLSEPPDHESSASLSRCLPRAISKLRNRQAFAEACIELPTALPSAELLVDAEQLSSALAEMLSNAFSALQEFPEPDRALKKIRVSANLSAGVCCLSVQNPTVQKPELALETIFHPFVTHHSDRKHLGLGLTMIHAIASRFGGAVSAHIGETEDENFFCLQLELPCEVLDDAVIAPAEDQKFTAASGSSIRILLVEDEVSVASAMEKLLVAHFGKSAEVSVTIVPGRESLNLLGRGEVYQAILCDLNLKDTSGKHVYQTLLRRWPQFVSRFAFLTGEPAGSPSLSYIEETGRPFLHKPFDSDALLELASKLIDVSQ